MTSDPHRGHHQPRVERRAARAYAAIAARAEDDAGFRSAVDRAVPALFRWLAAHGLPPAGPVLLRYLVVDETALPQQGAPPSTFQVGVPFGGRAAADGEVQVDELPAGDWVVTCHRGGFSGLPGAHAVAHGWIEEEGLRVDRRPDERGTAYGGSVEWFVVGPADEADPWRWETEVAYLLGDDRA